MERLRRQDLERLLDFAAEVYACRSVESLRVTLLSRLHTLVGSTISAWNEYGVIWPQVSAGSVRYVADPAGADPPGGAEVLNRHLDEHPIVAHYRTTGDGSAVKISDFLSTRQYHSRALYFDFFRHATPRIEDILTIHVRPRRSTLVAVALCRDRRTFTERDRAILDVVRRHAGQAYRNIMRFEVAQERLARTTPHSGHTAWEIVVIDAKSRFVGISDRARRWLQEYFPARDTSFVPDRIRRWIADERGHLTARGLENGGHTTPLVVDRPGRRLVVTMLPDRGGTTLVLAEERTGSDAASLRSLGLRARETEVLYWVSRGRTNAEVASILDIRPRTVGKHLERIFEQLGVENRTAAASRALEALAPDRSDLRSGS